MKKFPLIIVFPFIYLIAISAHANELHNAVQAGNNVKVKKQLPTGADANADDVDVPIADSISLRGGELLVKGEANDMKLFLNDKMLRDGDGYMLSFEKQYAIGTKDIVLVMNNSGGSACPVLYFFVTATTQGVAKLTPEFGTCSDLAKAVKKGSRITVTMPEWNGGSRKVKYIFENGVVSENGKVAK